MKSLRWWLWSIAVLIAAVLDARDEARELSHDGQ